MLTALSIRDIVLIDQLDLTFDAGLTVLTGETGAGKSILLDSLGLALGGRAEAGLLRAGAGQASVAACFHPPPGHRVTALLAEQGVAADAADGLVLRRVVGRDGRSRAFVNDQPVGVALLRRIGALLVEIQGQHDQQGLADPAMQTALLDAYGVPPALLHDVAHRFRLWRDAVAALAAARTSQEADARDRDWLAHAVAELTRLGPDEGEEHRLAGERQRLQQGERRAEAVTSALGELTARDRRGAGPAAGLRSAMRALQKLGPLDTALDGESREAAAAMAALERAEEALGEAETLLTRLSHEIEPDPRALERAEERLFALRAAARKHNVAVVELPALLVSLTARLTALDSGAADLARLEAAAGTARTAYFAAAQTLSQARTDGAARLDRAIARELPPLRLDKARFVTAVTALPEASWGAQGADQVRFLITTNPGQAPGPLARIASGGELSRLMLALKVVLIKDSQVPTIVFDEVDSGIGGATAAAVGDRLARVAERVQVLVVTHSPQVAARGGAHLRVAKQAGRGRSTTRVAPLDPEERREEIARMLAGNTVTDAARRAADSLLGTA